MDKLENARMLFQLKRFELAEQAVKGVLSEHPDDPGAYALGALIKCELHQTKRGHQLADQAISLAPAWGYVYHVKAVLCLRTGDLNDAITSIAEAIRLEPQEASHHRFRSVVLQTNKAWRSAIDAAKQAIALSPQDETCFYQLGHCLYCSDRKSEAKDVLEQGLRLNPNHAGAHCLLGKISLERNQYDHATQHLSFALQNRPDLSEAQVAWQDLLSARFWFYRYPSNIYRLIRYRKRSLVFLCYYLLCIGLGLIAYIISHDGLTAGMLGIGLAVGLPLLHFLNYGYLLAVSELVLNANKRTRRMLTRRQRMSVIGLYAIPAIIATTVVLHYAIDDRSTLIVIRFLCVFVVLILASFSCSFPLATLLWLIAAYIVWNAVKFWVKG